MPHGEGPGPRAQSCCWQPRAQAGAQRGARGPGPCAQCSRWQPLGRASTAQRKRESLRSIQLLRSQADGKQHRGGGHPVENRTKSSLPVLCSQAVRPRHREKTQGTCPNISFLSYSGLQLSSSAMKNTLMGTGSSLGFQPILLHSNSKPGRRSMDPTMAAHSHTDPLSSRLLPTDQDPGDVRVPLATAVNP